MQDFVKRFPQRCLFKGNFVSSTSHRLVLSVLHTVKFRHPSSRGIIQDKSSVRLYRLSGQVRTIKTTCENKQVVSQKFHAVITSEIS